MLKNFHCSTRITNISYYLDIRPTSTISPLPILCSKSTTNYCCTLAGDCAHSNTTLSIKKNSKHSSEAPMLLAIKLLLDSTISITIIIDDLNNLQIK